MKEFSALLVTFTMIGVAIRFAYKMRKQEITPPLSTWLIFLVSSSLSLISYAVAEDKDFLSGILNTADTLATIIISVSIIIWTKAETKFQPFEKWYGLGAIIIILLWITVLTSYNANLVTQVLISIGYIPTIHNMIKNKENTEDFFVWIPVFLAGLVALYPATKGGNVLSIVYASRTMIFVGLVLITMLYYKIKNKKDVYV